MDYQQNLKSMKKIFTLLTGLFITLVTFAANRPMVTVKASKNYEIVIDGKSYFSNNYGNTINIGNLMSGRHTVRVFEVNRSLFRSTRKLVSTSAFRLKNKDVAITVDRFGQLRIIESKYGKDFDRDNRRDDDWGRDRDNDRDRDGRGRNDRY
jgi:hypothetical protein